MRRLKVPLVFLTLPWLLAACGSTSEQVPEPLLLDFGPACPATAVLSDAASVTKLRPGSPPLSHNPANVVFTAEMMQAVLECDYDQAANRLTIDMEFNIRASRGPAAAGPDPELDFFIAVIDFDNNVVAKSVYRSRPVMNGRTSNTYVQTVSNFPVPLAMDTRPYDYQILTGFQLTPDELAYNRAPRPLPVPRAQVQ